jgi:lipopolysaccharide biosynthesis glycosyltransferase
MLSNNNPIHVAAACDENYAMALAVVLSSIASNLGEARKAIVYVLERGLATDTKDKVERSIPPNRLKLCWLSINAGRLAFLERTLRSFDTVSLESYYRLLLPEVLPAELDKVIYLDCDLVVNRDLGELWDLDVSETYLLAVPELALDSRFVSSKAGIRLYRELALPPDLELFNSGVMVINLRKWREQQLAWRAITYLREAAHYLRWHDQEALNAVLGGEWTALDPRWNVSMHVFGGKASAQHNVDLCRDPFIVHYNSAIKPWHPDFSFGFRELFFRQLDNTAWAGWRPSPLRFRALRRWRTRITRAAQKRHHASSRYVRRARLLFYGWRVVRQPLQKLDGWEIPTKGPTEIRVFIISENPSPVLSYLLTHYLSNGADRLLIALNGESIEHVQDVMQSHERLHVFAVAQGRQSRHTALRQLLHRYGQAHWCVLVDNDELLLYPHAETLSLENLCAYLDARGFEALACHVLDMASPAGPAGRTYREGEDPRLVCPCFNPNYQCIDTVACDPMSGRVFTTSVALDIAGERIDDRSHYRTKVPLLKYRSDLHIATDVQGVHGARLADVEGVLLRFRHLSTVAESLADVDQPDHGALPNTLLPLPEEFESHSSLRFQQRYSGRFRDTAQLARLGIVRSTPGLDVIARTHRGARGP